MKSIFKTHLLISLCIAQLVSGCGDKFLDRLNNDALVVPETLEDMQALLDNTTYMNGTITSAGCPLPSLGEVSTDDFYFEDQVFRARPQSVRDIYKWEPYYIYDSSTKLNWIFPYKSILYANVVLDNLKKIVRTAENSALWDNVYGSALFYRANVYFHLSQVFAPPYGDDASNHLGVPLRLEGDISMDVERKDLKATYELFIHDLENSLTKLPNNARYLTRPSKVAVHALLAKIYLVMADFEQAKIHSIEAIKLHGLLLDYNTLDLNSEYPIPPLNDEVLFHANMATHTLRTHGIVNESLFSLYQNGDLRKDLFYNSNGNFKGSYSGTDDLFGGLTSSEMYLVVAECLAREGNGREALIYLDKLRVKRFQPDNFVASVYENSDRALDQVLLERRRELILRGSTWSDLRRLNKFERSKRVLRKVVEGETRILEPGDLRYTLLIPEETIRAMGIDQNER